MIRWFRPPGLGPAMHAYLDATPRRVPRKTPFENLEILVLDAETTGFDPARDRMLSVAIVPVAQARFDLGGLRTWLLFQESIRMTEAVAVHGILPCETALGIPEHTVVEELLPLLHGKILVGHHVRFDAAMIDAALRRRFGSGLRNPILDTAHMAMQLLDAFKRTGYAGQRPPSLEEVCALLGINMVARHTAAGDTFTTAELFLLLCARLRRRLGRPLRAGDLPLSRF